MEEDDEVNSQEEDKISEILSTFSGARFADYTELSNIIMLIDVIKKNHIFIHPKDVNVYNLENFKKCEDVIEEFDKESFGTPDYINNDISQMEYKCIQTQFIDGLKKTFKSKKKEYDQVKKAF